MLIFACSKVNTPEDVIPQSKYSLIKQNAETYFSDYATAFQATGHKYFGQAHDGTFDKTQFEKDLSTAFHEKHPVAQSPAAKKILIQSWDPKKETLVDYMNQMGVSKNVALYVLAVQNSVISSFDIAKLESKEQDMNQVVANIVSNMDKLGAKAEHDKSLSETEIIAVLIATTAAKSLTSAIASVTTEFFTNLNVSNGRNQASLRNFWQTIRAVANVLTTIVVRVVIDPIVTIAKAVVATGRLLDSCLNGNCEVDAYFNGLANWIDSNIVFNYDCYLPDDGWRCQ